MAELLPVSSFDCIVLGGTGDLALRKLLPALFHRWKDQQIPEDSRIFAVSRGKLSKQAYLDKVREKFATFYPTEQTSDEDWEGFAKLVEYVSVNVGDPNGGWDSLGEKLGGDDKKIRVFYLALPPSLYGSVCANIDQAGLKTPLTRVVLEKPIGSNLETAREINDAVGKVFNEEQVFRIDHYLGKETVQNLLILRFANSIFEPLWNSSTIDHVQITVAESIGAGNRASYYDKSGALRDMVQNHILQLLCLVAMEPPLDLGADTVRDEKIKVLRALRRFTQEEINRDTIRGQYKDGAVDGEKVEAYADELGEQSKTETFVAIKATIDNWRWANVPFYLRTGKRMSDRRSEIVIQFKDVPHSVVGQSTSQLNPTRLVIRLQPDEGMKLILMTKEPGPGGMRLRYVPLNLSYAETFNKRYPDAYERLLMAVVRGDLALFMRRDEVEAAWHWVDGILAAWEGINTKTHLYPAGADGPAQSHAMLGQDGGREWWSE